MKRLVTTRLLVTAMAVVYQHDDEQRDPRLRISSTTPSKPAADRSHCVDSIATSPEGGPPPTSQGRDGIAERHHPSWTISAAAGRLRQLNITLLRVMRATAGMADADVMEWRGREMLVAMATAVGRAWVTSAAADVATAAGHDR